MGELIGYHPDTLDLTRQTPMGPTRTSHATVEAEKVVRLGSGFLFGQVEGEDERFVCYNPEKHVAVSSMGNLEKLTYVSTAIVKVRPEECIQFTLKPGQLPGKNHVTAVIAA